MPAAWGVDGTVALAHGLNASLLRRSVAAAEPTPGVLLPATTVEGRAAAAAFVPPPLPALPPSAADGPICIELVCGTTTIRMQWPASTAAQYAA